MKVAALVMVLSACLCWLYLLLARRWQILDVPNERSSHAQPTPHGGGVPLLLAFTVGFLVVPRWYGPWPAGFGILVVGALGLMLLGVLDDLRHLSVRLRFACYSLCSALVSVVLLPAAGWPDLVSASLLVILAALSILWLLNLYNFMDGIDGIAALQCVLACSAAALLTLSADDGSAYSLFCLLLAASHLGFLLWNWPPARLFMGDAGSIPSGFLIGGMALLGSVQGQLNPLCWLILLAAFITDASWTLAWRVVTGQPFTRPHRSHAYQRLSRHWNSHLAVDILLVAVNALWLFPLAWVAQIWPEYSLFMVILAYLPLVLGMAKIRDLA